MLELDRVLTYAASSHVRLPLVMVAGRFANEWVNSLTNWDDSLTSWAGLVESRLTLTQG